MSAISKKVADEIAAGDLYALLSVCANKELDPLVTILLSRLANSIEINEDYKKHKPNHRKYHKLIGDDIRAFGGNTWRNIFRGGGPPYSEIVEDVCKKLDVPFEPGQVVRNESNILTIYLDRKWKSLSKEEQDALMKEARANATGDLSDVASMAKEGAKFLLLRSIAGPLGWASLIVGIADPAFKVTVPCVVHIAWLRRKYLAQLEQKAEKPAKARTPKQTAAASRESLPTPAPAPLQRGEALIIGQSADRPLFALAEVEDPGERRWTPAGDGDRGIGILNPALQAVPALATAGLVATTKFMEVVVPNGATLSNSKEIAGAFRGFFTDGKGVSGHANLLEPTSLSNLVNAAAVWQIASVLVAQKHLADINAKLSEIKGGISKIHDFQKTERRSVLTGAIRYFEQVAPAVLAGELSDGIRHQIERHEADLLKVQDHLLDDIRHEAAALRDVKAKQEAIETHQKTLAALFSQLLLCIRARACGWQLLLVFPGEEMLKAGRKRSIQETLQILDESGELLEETDKAVRERVRQLTSSWGMTSNKEKLLLLEGVSALEKDVDACKRVIEQEITVADTLVAAQREPVRVLVKVEEGRIVATAPL